MEHAQRVEKKEIIAELLKNVLILILMEHAQRVYQKDMRKITYYAS